MFSRFFSALRCYFTKELWERADTRSGRLFRAVMQRVVLATKVFLRERMQFRASALTYSLLFSIVPILAIVFAIAKGFGLAEFLESRIRQAFETQPEVADTLLGFVDHYLVRAQGGVFLGFGILLLLYSLFSLCGNVEASFNQIWQQRADRRLARKVTDYTTVFFLLPIFLVVSSGLSIFLSSFVESLPDVFFLHSSLLTLLQFLPYLLMVVFCSLLYAFMPNVHVRFRSALVAGIPVGIVVQALQYLYIHSQVYLTSYNAVYGSFAALPLLMLWGQILWYVILYGCALSYVDQHISNFYYGKDKLELSRSEFDRRTLGLLRAVSLRAREGGEAYSFPELAASIGTPEPVVADILATLSDAGIIEAAVPSSDNREVVRYYLRRDVSSLTVGSVLAALDRCGATLPAEKADTAYNRFRAALYEGGYAATPLHELTEI
ncbi:MAG: YihY family inner membrane protein [Alloprevotella sp.]|nr:YihY family inner membrane protein [Alloprevotella sp.]